MTYSIALVGDPFQNLVQNGSFESPSIGHGINGFVSTVPGWTSDIFDIWSGLNGMPAYDGEQNLELDTNDSRIGQGITVGISQTVPTIAGRTYLLSFAVANHPQSNVSRVEARWNGIPVQTAQQVATTWSIFEAQVLAAGSTSRLEFRSNGPADALGDFIDDVRLVELNTSGGGGGGGMGPSISGLVPTSVAANSGSFTLRVNGSNFCDGSAVNFDGQPLETTFVAGRTLWLTGIFLQHSSRGAESLRKAPPPLPWVNQGEISCALGMSQPATLTIDPAGGGMAGDPPEITLITPNTVQAGGPSFTLRVDGPHFCPASDDSLQTASPQRTTLHGAGQNRFDKHFRHSRH